MDIPVRDTEEEAIQVWRDIVGQADTEAVKKYSQDVQQAGKSAAGGKGTWSDSSLEGRLLFTQNFSNRSAEDAPHRSRPVQ